MKKLSSLLKIANRLRASGVSVKAERVYRRGAKINILLCGERECAFSKLFTTLVKKSRAKISVAFGGDRLQNLPTVLLLVEKESASIVSLSVGVSAGGFKGKIECASAESRKSLLVALSAIKEKHSKFVQSEYIEKGEKDITVYCTYFDDERFDSFIMEQANLLAKESASLWVDGAYQPSETDFNAITLFTRFLDGVKVEKEKFVDFDERLYEGDEVEDRIILARIHGGADEETTAKIAYSFIKITEAI